MLPSSLIMFSKLRLTFSPMNETKRKIATSSSLMPCIFTRLAQERRVILRTFDCVLSFVQALKGVPWNWVSKTQIVYSLPT